MINDIEFIDGFANELTQDYASAKSYVRDIPTQALVFVRSFTHKLTQYLASKHGQQFTSPNLYDRIEQLNKARVIDVPTVRALHRLRGDGNRGAHPEKYHLTQVQLITIAEKSIKHILTLVSKLYSQYSTHSPEYHFEAFDSFAGRDLCYRAVMKNDPEAQYLVGMSLKAKGLMQQGQEQALEQKLEQQASTDTGADESHHQPSLLRGSHTAKEAFSQAAHWFALASSSHDLALYEHGVSLLHGYSGDKNLKQGETLIAQAAQHHVVDAKALLGYFYLVGSDVFEVDIAKAEHWLLLAANSENAEAMSNLGVLYYQQQQLGSAFEWIKKAAETGYAHAQYHLSLMFESGDAGEIDLEKAWHWFQEAAKHGQLDAMLRCAIEALNNENANEADLAQAEQYLHDVIKYGHSATAMIELSVALADGMLGRIDVVQSANLLVLAKQYANPQQLSVIEPLWESLAIQIDNVIALKPSADELKSLQHAQSILA
ncbi:DUF4145 domain-containing protein [Shewanella intestini]|uniref:DUF4145 domain-containing protein n=1 Tax=Shewanella intestini TaxID=2017544 RepID=A0ABS5I3Y1_9GAMM|nr:MULTISPECIES: tetratricopeptide repeat protein [Shewanella]MBR9728732.1 DUF4145 domain-containing protein [Shewanella intestini]MRG36808.1 DUF4145 domain-containing protein [Shewanella sp. XMDDZSB0408]